MKALLAGFYAGFRFGSSHMLRGREDAAHIFFFSNIIRLILVCCLSYYHWKTKLVYTEPDNSTCKNYPSWEIKKTISSERQKSQRWRNVYPNRGSFIQKQKERKNMIWAIWNDSLTCMTRQKKMMTNMVKYRIHPRTPWHWSSLLNPQPSWLMFLRFPEILLLVISPQQTKQSTKAALRLIQSWRSACPSEGAFAKDSQPTNWSVQAPLLSMAKQPRVGRLHINSGLVGRSVFNIGFCDV